MSNYSYKLTSELLDSLLQFNTYNSVLDFGHIIDDVIFSEEKTLFTYDTYISYMYDNNLYVNKLEETIKEIFPKKLTLYGIDVEFEVGKITQPKYYNYKSDYINIDVEVSLNHLTSVIDMFAVEFNSFLERYKSYPGFISYMPSNISEWINADNVYKVATALNFLAERTDFQLIDNFAIYETIEYFNIFDYIDNNIYNDYLAEKKELDALIVQSFRKSIAIDIDSLDYTYIDNVEYISEYIIDKINELKNVGQYEIEFL